MKIYIGVDGKYTIVSSSPLKWAGQGFEWVNVNAVNKYTSFKRLEETIRDYILSEAGLVNAPVGSIGELEI